MIIKSYKYRIYPTPQQKDLIDKTFGACRLVYNLALEVKIRAWQSAQKNLTSIDLCYQLVDLKEAFPWMREVDSQALQASVKKIDIAFKSFFRGNGYPKFKKKTIKQTFRCPNGNRIIDWEKSKLTIPKIKDIPIIISKRFEGRIKTVTIGRSSTGKYFASLLVETPNAVPDKPPICPEKAIGIDLGIKSFVVVSDGRAFEPNRFLKNSLKRLKCLQRRASRKRKGSANRKKTNLYISKLHEKISNQRIDYCHKITTALTRDSQAESLMVENLAVVNMLKNRRLAQAISDVSFGEFFRQMKYKCEWYGKNLVIIDRFAPSSKRCSDCGQINDNLTLADREWTCECGAHHDRDLNAAKNIKFFGLNTPAGSRGGPVESRRLRRAKKQEITPMI